MNRLVVTISVAATLLFLLLGHVRCQIILTTSQLYANKSNQLLLISNRNTRAILTGSFFKSFNESFQSDEISFEKDRLQEWPLFIPKFPKKEHVYLKLEYPERMEHFVDEFPLTYEDSFVFFHSDKPIYKVHETVRLRATRLSRSLDFIEGDCKISILDNSGIKVEEGPISIRTPYYIGEYSFSFPLTAKAGIWNAELHYGPNFELKEKVQFEMSKFELPIYKVDILLPNYVLHNPSNSKYELDFALKVAYTYGKPVDGVVYFKYYIQTYSVNIMIKSSNIYCVQNGTFNGPLFLNISEDYFGKGFRLKVEAVFTDTSTSITEKAINNRTALIKVPYAISTRNTVMEYKPSVANYIMIEIQNKFNYEPVAGVPVNLTLINDQGQIISPYIISQFHSSDKQISDENGLVIFTFKVFKLIGPLTVKIQTIDDRFPASKQTKKQFLLKPFSSEEEAFVLIANKRKLYYTSGSRFESTVVCHGNVDKNSIHLIVLSKGIIMYTQKIDPERLSFDFALHNKMVPSVRILIVAFDQDGQLISDSFRILLQQNKCGVEVTLNSAKKLFEPKESVTFALRGAINDVVGFQAVDEAVYVLRNRKGLDRNKFNRVLSKSDLGCGMGSGDSSLNIIQSSGLAAFGEKYRTTRAECSSNTGSNRKSRSVDIDVSAAFLQKCCQLARLPVVEKMPCLIRKDIVAKYINEDCAQAFFKCCTQPERLFHASVAYSAKPQESGIHNSKTVEAFNVEDDDKIVRSDFRDSWLFDIVILNKSEEIFEAKLPDSITTWAITPLSITQRDGLCFNEEIPITTFKPFFIHVALPSHLKQHEQTEIVVTIFNYLERRLNVFVQLFRNNEICSEATFPKDYVRKQVSVNAQDKAKVHFPIVPIDYGKFQIKVKAWSHFAADIVVKDLIVDPPGMTKSDIIAFDLDPANRTRRGTERRNQFVFDRTESKRSLQNTKVFLNKHRYQIVDSNEQNIVPNTIFYYINAQGDRFSPNVTSIEDLNNLIKKPKGCGEQNMYYMAFNLYTMIYLKKIKKLDKRLEHKGIGYLKRANKQQMKFRKEDGSYSAFDRRPSSVWLTAFVSKVMCQAAPFLKENLDSKIITEAVKWLRDKQKRAGYWDETYSLLHEKALGGIEGPTTLTAYVLIALNQCQDYLNSEAIREADSKLLKDTIEKANNYIVGQNLKSKNAYSLALVAYSLTFNKTDLQRRISDDVLDRLVAISKFDKRYQFQYWESSFPVETAAYALMALIQADSNPQVEDYLPISNWLTSKQKLGTFDNTQNTVVALEALSKYHQLIDDHSKPVQLVTNIAFDSRHKRSIEFNENNVGVVQYMEVDKGTDLIDFETKGNGLGKVEVLLVYNEYSPTDACFFDIEVKLQEVPIDTDQIIESEDFDENEIFNKPELKKELRIKSKSELATAPKSYRYSTLQCTPKRSKRSFSFSNVTNWFKRRKNQQKFATSPRPKTTPSPYSKRAAMKELPQLPRLSNEYSVIRQLNVCMKALNGSVKEMSVLELSMLSGYEPVEEDLQRLIKLREHNNLENYHNERTKVIFYFSRITSGRSICLNFRVFQAHPVTHIQSALVKLYEFYNEVNYCTRMYSDIRSTKYINYDCKSDKCKCVVKKRCPNNDIIDEISEGKKIDYAQWLDKFYKLICSYSSVTMGRVTRLPANDDANPSTIYLVKVEKLLLADDYSMEFKVRLNPECNSAIENGTLILVMIMEKSNDPIYLMDGQTIFTRYSDILDDYVYEWERVHEKNCADYRK